MDTNFPLDSRDMTDLERAMVDGVRDLAARLVSEHRPSFQVTCEALLAGSANLLARTFWGLTVRAAEMGMPPEAIIKGLEAAEQRVLLNARKWATEFEF
jgi:hypothetical protein